MAGWMCMHPGEPHHCGQPLQAERAPQHHAGPARGAEEAWAMADAMTNATVNVDNAPTGIMMRAARGACQGGGSSGGNSGGARTRSGAHTRERATRAAQIFGPTPALTRITLLQGITCRVWLVRARPSGCLAVGAFDKVPWRRSTSNSLGIRKREPPKADQLHPTSSASGDSP